MLQPVWEENASDSVKTNYAQIKSALQLPSIPLFFAYMGNFPEYLNYIAEQIVKNVEDQQFTQLTDELAVTIKDLIKGSLMKSEDMSQWLIRYDQTPSFYYFQKDTKKIFTVNIKLACIFISLREAVKGWAVAAKQLPKINKTDQEKSQKDNRVTGAEFIYDIALTPQANQTQDQKPISLAEQSGALATIPSQALEKDLLPQYLQLSRESFAQLIKEEQTLYLRVGLERLMLSSLQLFPHLIFSPINVVLKLTSSYDNFYELVYLLSEHFPTYAVQRVMFSGYLLQ